MNKKAIQVYNNGDFIKDEIDWIEQTPETLQEYIDKTYEWEEEWMFDGGISEEDINGLRKITCLERGYEKCITVYQHFDKYDYLVSIDYGEMTYKEWYACKDFKTLLAFLKELEPLLNLIEQEETIGYLEVISDNMSEILKPENYEWITNEKEILSRILDDFKDMDKDFKKWIDHTKRKKFMLNDLCKEVIKAKKISQ